MLITARQIASPTIRLADVATIVNQCCPLKDYDDEGAELERTEDVTMVSRDNMSTVVHHQIASLNCNHRCVIALECFNATSPYESSFYTSPQHCRR